MKTTKVLALIGGFVGVLGAGWAIAGTPFGGDDGGFIPPTKDIGKCEDSVGKNLGKAANCILGCHKKRAKGSLADETAEEACENNGPAAKDCKSKYNVATGNPSKINSLCPPCLDATARANLYDTVEGLIDTNNDKIYCTPGTAWGGDDTGFIPPDKAAEKCEDGVGKVAGKTIACIIKCHKARAAGKLADDTAEDNCESGASPSSCKGKYDKKTSKLTCDPCLDKAGLYTFIENNADALNGAVYCASPSGAFLD
jgi:hypothetical protein